MARAAARHSTEPPQVKGAIQSILNKLTEEKFDTLYDKLVQLLTSPHEQMELTIDAIMENVFFGKGQDFAKC